VDPFNKKEMKLFSQNGRGPTIKKAAILGLAHDPDQKLMEKI